MQTLHEAPKPSAFVPLLEHQSATPASFYTGPPVLHYFSDRCKVLVLEHELDNAPALAALAQQGKSTEDTNGTFPNGGDSHTIEDEGPRQKVVEDVDVWVTSDKLLLFSEAASIGVAIPYPSISLHAIQSLPQPSPGEQQGLYMQLVSESSEPAEEDNEPESISMTIIPTASAPPAAATENDPAEDQPEQTPVTALFTALSNCSNLHPDPIDPDDPEQGQLAGSRLFQAGMIEPGDAAGGLPPAMPGSGGWITAENMHEFVDEDGNWIGGDEEDEQDEDALGPGAGTVRTRDDGQEEEDDDESTPADETKWRRTS